MEKNNIDVNLYNEKSLYLLNIRELRDMGRKLGVPSPTTMKKHDLVEYILKVVYGEVEPPIRNSYGRPNSREFDMNEYLTKIKKNTEFANQLKEARLYDDLDFEKAFTFKAAAPKTQSLIREIEQRVVFIDDTRCQLRVRQFIESEGDIEISRKLAENLKLENFDVVELIHSAGGIKIISINGKKVLEIIKPFKVYGENIVAGTRKVFHLRTKEEIIKNIEIIKQNCTEQEIKFVYLGHEKTAGVADEDCFIMDSLAGERVMFKKLMLFIEYIKKQVFENKNVVAVVEEQRDIDFVMDRLEDDIAERIRHHLNEDINDFVNLGNILISFKHIKSVSY